MDAKPIVLSCYLPNQGHGYRSTKDSCSATPQHQSFVYIRPPHRYIYLLEAHYSIALENTMARHLASSFPKALSDRIFSPTFFGKAPKLPSTATGPKKSFQIMSDLHLEFSSGDSDQYLQFEIPPKAPYLILAGDIGLLAMQYTSYLSFLRRQTENFEHVFLVLGNHEFYRAPRAEGLIAAEKMEEELQGRLTVLNRKRVDLPDGVTVLGVTLHSMILEDNKEYIARLMNDFYLIKDWTVEDHIREHGLDMEWLKKELAAIDAEEATGVDKRVVIVTHHAPSFTGTSAPEHKNSLLGSAFCTEVLSTVEKRWRGAEMVRLWVFGHTHFCTDFSTRGGIRVVANQKGYPNEKGLLGNFDVEMVVAV